MYQTIQISSCVSVQGELVNVFANGDVAIRDGHSTYRGRPIGGKHRFDQLRAYLSQAAPSQAMELI